MLTAAGHLNFRAPARVLVTQRASAWVRNLSLQWKLGLLVLVGLMLLFSLFLVLGELLTDQTARDMANERMSVTRLTAAFLDRQFEEQFRQLEWVASQIELGPGADTGEPQHWAELTRSSETIISGAFLVDTGGDVVWSDRADVFPVGDDLSGQGYVQEPLTTGERYASPVFADAATGHPTVVFAVPVKASNGQPIGVLGATLDATDPLFKVLTTAAGELGTSGHAELVDQNLRLIASNERNHALGPGEHPTFYGPLLQQHESAVGLTDPIGDEDPQDRGERHIMAFVSLRSVPWGVAIGGSESAFTALSERWRWYTLPIGALGLGIALFLVWMTRRRIVAPLQRLASTSQRIAAGDLSTPVEAGGDGEVGMLAQAFDDMRRRLLQAHEAEAELSRLKDDFLAIASHELRTPVAALSALTQLQRRRLERGQDVSQREALGEIHEQLERLGRLVGQLLDSSRLQNGKFVLERRPSDLARIVDEAAQAVRVTDSGDHPVNVMAPPSVQAVVDPMRISQVVTNLLDNAIKHSPPGAEVDVELRQPAPELVRLVVRDRGPGIPDAQRARVFDRFFQDPESKIPGSGLGLGLYVSREIVQLHSGEIEVESPADGGAAFVVTLPTAGL